MKETDETLAEIARLWSEVSANTKTLLYRTDYELYWMLEKITAYYDVRESVYSWIYRNKPAGRHRK